MSYFRSLSYCAGPMSQRPYSDRRPVFVCVESVDECRRGSRQGAAGRWTGSGPPGTSVSRDHPGRRVHKFRPYSNSLSRRVKRSLRVGVSRRTVPPWTSRSSIGPGITEALSPGAGASLCSRSVRHVTRVSSLRLPLSPSAHRHLDPVKVSNGRYRGTCTC